MSFLCRAIIRRKHEEKNKKEDLLVKGRITGSDSIDTITQIGLVHNAPLRPSARRFMLQDFVACTEEEMTVRKGEIVYILYRDHDWFYATTPDGREGFIPISFCSRLSGRRSPSANACMSLGKLMSGRIGSDPERECNDVQGRPVVNKLPSSITEAQDQHDQGPKNLVSGSDQSDFIKHGNTSNRNTIAMGQPNSTFQMNHSDFAPLKPYDQRKLCKCSSFSKTCLGNFLVLFDFYGTNENDLEVRRGEIVVGLNDEDEDWLWIQRGDFLEGFVPYTYVCPLRPNSCI